MVVLHKCYQRVNWLEHGKPIKGNTIGKEMTLSPQQSWIVHSPSVRGVASWAPPPGIWNPTLTFQREWLSLKLKLVFLGRLAGQTAWGSACLGLPCACSRVKASHHCSCLFCGCPRPELWSSCLHTMHFIHWAISPAPRSQGISIETQNRAAISSSHWPT